MPVAIPIKATLDCIKNITVGWNRAYDVSLMLENMDLYLDFETSQSVMPVITLFSNLTLFSSRLIKKPASGLAISSTRP